jgi:hypothetical protein
MRRHRISDHDAAALLAGSAPLARPELAPLAQSLAHFRVAAFEALPQPSAELASRLDLAQGSEISTLAVSSPDSGMVTTPVPATAAAGSHRERVKNMFEWITGLSLAAKILLGLSVAAVAGVTGAGASGAFTDIVVSQTPTEEEVIATDEPADESTDGTTDESSDDPADEFDNFGESVSERAHELGEDGDGRAFGEEISGEAQQLGDEKRQNGSPVTDAPVESTPGSED